MQPCHSRSQTQVDSSRFCDEAVSKPLLTTGPGLTGVIFVPIHDIGDGSHSGRLFSEGQPFLGGKRHRGGRNAPAGTGTELSARAVGEPGRSLARLQNKRRRPPHPQIFWAGAEAQTEDRKGATRGQRSWAVAFRGPRRATMSAPDEDTVYGLARVFFSAATKASEDSEDILPQEVLPAQCGDPLRNAIACAICPRSSCH